MIDLTGQTLGQYQMLEQIGEGGMATVYKAFQPSLDRYVAVKILPPYFMHEAGFAKRFEREAKAVAQLVHPNILPIYDFGHEGNLSYIVMRYVDAGTLKARMTDPLPLSEIARIMDDLASALDYAHQQGVIHRDVKPGNVLMDERGWVLLSDFGLAKMAEGSVALTGSGVGVGTPAYMSPEQGQGFKVDHRTDIYSLGVMLYEMVVGHVPYDAETPFAIVLKHIADPLPLPRKLNPNIPQGVERVVLKAMAKNPDDRFGSAGDMATALRSAVAAEPGAAAEVIAPAAAVGTGAMEAPIETAHIEPPSAPTALEPAEPVVAPRRPPWLWLAAGAAALALVLGIGAIALLAALLGEPEKSPALVEATEAPIPVQPAEAPAVSQPTQPPPVEAVIPPELLTPPPEGLILEPCGEGEGQICIYEIGQPQPVERIPVGMSVRSPAWSPDGERIVFSTKGEDDWTDLWAVARDGSDLHAVSDEPEVNELNPAWSPTGEWIAFHRNGEPYLQNLDGRRLTEVPLPDDLQGCMNWPAWSPDGEQLAFLLDDNRCRGAEGRQSVNMTLVAVQWDGEHPRRLIEWETSNPGDTHVAWSPDGQFVTYQPEANQEWFLVRTDGSGESFPIGERPDWWFSDFWSPRGQPQPPPAQAGPPPFGTVLEGCEKAKGHICLRQSNDQIQSIPIDERLWFRGPTWSPDGMQIAVSASDRGDPYDEAPAWAPGDLYIIDTACFSQPETCGDHLRRITSGEDNDIQPAWSPDGQWIAFHRNGDLAVVHPDGSESTHFNFNLSERCVLEPTWSPDSQQIAFFNVVGGCEGAPPFDLEVRVVGLEGEGDRAIWREGVDDWPWTVAWSPDGQAVAAAVNIEGGGRWLLIPLDDGAVTEMRHEPFSWLPEHWPQWGGEDVGTAPPDAKSPLPFEWKLYDDFNGDRLDTDERWFVPPVEFPLEIGLSDSRLKVHVENDTDGFIGYPLISREDAPVMAVEATVGVDAVTGEEGSFVGVTLLGDDEEFWLLGLTGPNGEVLLHHGRGEEAISTQVAAHADCCPGEHNLRLRIEGDRLLAYLNDHLVADESLAMEPPRRFGVSIGLPPRATLSAYVNDVSVVIAR